MSKFKYILFSLLFLSIFIPSFTLAEEQEHLIYSGSSYNVPFEYYSLDVNVPIEYVSYKTGSSSYKSLRTVDGSYGFFTAYYDNAYNVSSYDNEIYIDNSAYSGNDVPLEKDFDGHNLLKVVFTPARQLQEGEYFTSDEFVGYSLFSFLPDIDYVQSVISDNFGTITDGFTFSANILYHFNSNINKNLSFLYYYASYNSLYTFITFNPSTGAFCNYADTFNCIYPNIQSGEPFNITIEYVKSTYDFIVNINGEVLSFNRKLDLSSCPFFEFSYYNNVVTDSSGFASYRTLINSVTISEGSKYIKFYPTVINLGSSVYQCVNGWTSNTNNFYNYFLDNSSGFYTWPHSYSYGSGTSPLFHIDKTILNSGGSGGSGDSGGSSGSGGGSGTITNDNFYKRIYPPQNVTPIADWVTRIRSTYERLGKQHLALYMTRYNKELDALYGYYILWDPSDASTLGNIAYNLNSDNTISITLSDDITTNFALTTVFDHDLLNNYTPVEAGAVGEDLLNYKNWNTYNSLYLSPNDIGLFGSIFGATDFINFGSNIFGIKKYTYSDLEIDKTLTLLPITTNKNDIYGNPLTFYAAVSSTDKYNDYYVLLNLSDGINSNVKDIYNSAWYKDNNTGEPVMTYYSVMPYLNINFSFAGTDNETTIIGTPSEDFDYSDTSYGKYGDDIKEAIKSEDEMKALSPIMILSENLSSLTDLLMGLTNDVSSIFYQINDNSTYYYTYLESLSDTNLITTGSFMSGELQWIYDNTPFNVPVNIGLCTSLVMAVIF